ncbi:alpha-xylosidase, partial [Acinetobacter baumannii]
DTLSIELKYSCQIWRYGTEEQTNLGGTARTLDAVDGALKLEKGLNSREGYVIIDDSKSLVFNEASWLEPRTTNSTDLYFFGYGTAYKECIADYCKLTGRTQLLPRYALGNWWSRYWEYSDTELEGLMNRFESEGIPLSVCIIDMDWHNVNIDPKYGSGWTGYTWNKNLFKDPKAFMTWLHDKGLRTSLNLHPADGIRGHEDCYESVAKYMGVDVSSEQPVPFDISSPKFMKAYFEKVHHPLEDEGVEFWWIDWQQ